jgi:hypothetical protein
VRRALGGGSKQIASGSRVISHQCSASRSHRARLVVESLKDQGNAMYVVMYYVLNGVPHTVCVKGGAMPGPSSPIWALPNASVWLVPAS